MQVIKVELPESLRTIEVIPIGDTHIGEEQADIQSVKDVIKYVLEKDNRYVILNGDLMNIALKNSKSDVYADRMKPSQQLDYVARLFEPLAINGRILAMGTGNHEDRVAKETDFDISYLLAKELGIEKRYADNSFVLFVKFGKSHSSRESRTKKNVYSFFVWHGAGGGNLSGGKLNRVMRMGDTVVCDVYIMNHVHDAMLKTQPIYMTDQQNMSVYMMDRYYMIGNSFLDFGGYGQKFGFRPSTKHIVSAELNGQGRKAVKLSTGGNLF